MKKFLTKILMFAVLIFGIGLVLWWKNGSQNYTNAYLNEKLDFLEKNPQFNTVFIGSSKINNQINPTIIDSLNPRVKSYNLGANGSFNLENFETIDYLLSQDKIKVKNIILELQNKTNFTRKNLNTPRSFSVLTPDNLGYAFRFHWSNKDYRQLAYTAYSFALNVLYFKREEEQTVGKEMNQFIHKNGFVPLDLDQNKGVIKRHQELLNDPNEIQRRIDAFENDQKKYDINSVFEQKLQTIRTKCQEKNIQFIVLIPAPAEPDAKVLLPYQNLKNIAVINLLNIERYPEFYQLENRWDYGHLNQKGADVLSEKVEKKIKNKLQK